MPKKLKPCSYPTCNEMTYGHFCPKHTRLVTQFSGVQQYPGNDQYGRAWVAIQAVYIKAHPLCERCKESNRSTAAEEVHHIQPLAVSGTNDWENLIALCGTCYTHAVEPSEDEGSA